MAQLAIKGHPTRGKEVIEILEMLGGANLYSKSCSDSNLFCYLSNEKRICEFPISESYREITLFTLEEFLEKFPYKVGDKVLREPYVGARQICEMRWDSDNNCIKYGIGVGEWFNVSQVQPYKEETMEKINIEKLLKDCPQGMELDCILFDAKVIYQGLSKRRPTHPIVVQTEHGFEFELTQYGQIHNIVGSNCVIFPKGKTSWEGFHRSFKDGDILFYNHKSNNVKYAFIYKRRIDMHYLLQYCGWFSEKPHLSEQFNMKERIPLYENDDIRFATEEEKEKLFKAIKDNGYKWNADTKTLEKVDEPKFHECDWIIRNNKYTGIPVKVIGFNGYYSCELNGEIVNLTRNDVHNNFHLWTINDAKDGDVIFYDSGWTCIFKRIHGIWYSSYCFITDDGEFHTGYEEHAVDATINGNAHPATEDQCRFLFRKMKEKGYNWNPYTKTLEESIKLKFKVGDVIVNNYRKHLNGDNRSWKIYQITNDKYIFTDGSFMYIQDQNNWVLNTAKFDITMLKPFDKVLARCSTFERWRIQLFEKYDKTCKYPFICMGYNKYKQCIPYEGNENLLDTADNCTDYFKTWE